MRYLGLILILFCTVVDVFGIQTKTLFYIERRKNANIVRYDVNVLPDGRINPEKPVIPYWVMLAKDGGTKQLNLIEKNVYGFECKFDKEIDAYRLVMNSVKNRPLKVYKVNDTFKAEVTINNKPAILEKIYIAGKETFPIPSVEWIELFGINKEDNTPAHEKIEKR